MPYHLPKSRRWFCAPILIFTQILFPLFASPASASNLPPTIVIGEIAWAGSSLSTSDEWIELWNLSDTTTTLSGWTLKGAGSPDIFLPTDAVIAPLSTYIISNYSSTDTKSALAVPTQVVTSTLSLSNSALRIDLIDASGTMIDSAGDGSAPFAGMSLPTKMSMIRLDGTASGTLATSWISATSSVNLKPNTPDLATPSICDGCVMSPPPVEISAPTVSSTILEIAQEPTTSTLSTDEATVIDTTTSTPSDPDTTDATDIITEVMEDTNDSGATPIEVVSSSTITENDPASTEPVALPSTDQDLVPQIPATTSTPPIASPLDSPPTYGMLRLNIVSPAPAAGHEWVEIGTLDASNSIDLEGCEIHDSLGLIMTIHDLILDPASSTTIAIELTSSKLNNTGDTVTLLSPTGQVLDSFTFEETDKGDQWMRVPALSGSWWLNGIVSSSSTPSTQTNPTTSSTISVSSPNSVSNSSPTSATSSSSTLAGTTSTKKTLVTTTTKKKSSPPAKKETALKTSSPKTEPAKTATASSTKKTVAPKKTPITPLTFDMIFDNDNIPPRVRLTGYVGSPPGLMAGHAFVLLAPDGRGLKVSVPTAKKLPLYGTYISITGRLRFDASNTPYFSLGTNDGWQVLTNDNGVQPTPRIVDLFLRMPEDAWSLMHVTGTVMDVNQKSARLSIDDVELIVSVKSFVNYRVERLKKGDTIVVTGIFDPGSETPRILPRKAEEITLVSHTSTPEKTSAGTTGTNSLPGWSPFAGAGTVVALSEGVKRALHFRKRKILEQKLEIPVGT